MDRIEVWMHRADWCFFWLIYATCAFLTVIVYVEPTGTRLFITCMEYVVLLTNSASMVDRLGRERR